MTRMEIGPARIKLLLLPVLVLALELGVYLYVSSSQVDSRIQQSVEDILLSRSALQSALLRHVELMSIAFLITAAVGLPLAIVLFRSGRLVRVPVLALASLGQAIPSIALLVLASTYIGLGIKPTVFALVIFALLPLLRNTIVGLEGVDPAAVEAARGMGMTDLQILRRVQIPLAAPVIMAGLRTSLVLIVGTATLGNFIGGGGLGDIIAEGIGASPMIGPRIVLAGAAMAAGLALFADWLMSLLTRVVVPRT
jgi:ABC-type proline/glycine betaine transport system permease subunit